MTEQDQDVLLGRLAVHYEILSKKQASEAIRLWRATQSGQDLGTFLLEESYVSPDMLAKLLRARAKYLQRTGAKERLTQLETAQPEAVATPVPEPEAAPPEAAEEPSPDDTRPAILAEGPVGAATVRLTPDMLAAAMAEPELTAEALPDEPSPVEIPAEIKPPAMEPVEWEPLVIEPETAQPEVLVPEPVASEEAMVLEEAVVLEEAAPAAVVEAAPESVTAAVVETAPAATGAGDGPMALEYAPGDTLEDLLRRARELGASDLHVHSGAPLKIRLHGTLRDASEKIDREAARDLVYGVLTEEQRALLEGELQLDFAFAIPGVGRFRANSYLQHWGLDGVFRIIPPEPPTLEQLGLPAILRRFSEYHQGIVLFTGPAGCGKSSTMAAMVRLINETRPEHVLSIEDPIEYVHQPAACVVNQREVGPHTESFARALRAALREDPDIIAIGELRDLETIQLALTAAETGHLVLGTLHTASTIPTINRIIGVFPPDQQSQIRNMVSESLRAIVSQRLVPRADGTGQVPALEILINNKAVGNLIRENRTFQINSVLQTGIAHGMCQLDVSLLDLLKEGIITKEAALKEAIDPKRFADAPRQENGETPWPE